MQGEVPSRLSETRSRGTVDSARFSTSPRGASPACWFSRTSSPAMMVSASVKVLLLPRIFAATSFGVSIPMLLRRTASSTRMEIYTPIRCFVRAPAVSSQWQRTHPAWSGRDRMTRGVERSAPGGPGARVSAFKRQPGVRSKHATALSAELWSNSSSRNDLHTNSCGLCSTLVTSAHEVSPLDCQHENWLVPLFSRRMFPASGWFGWRHTSERQADSSVRDTPGHPRIRLEPARARSTKNQWFVSAPSKVRMLTRKRNMCHQRPGRVGL